MAVWTPQLQWRGSCESAAMSSYSALPRYNVSLKARQLQDWPVMTRLQVKAAQTMLSTRALILTANDQ